MNLPNKWASALTGKDKFKAQQAAEHILNTPDIEAWQCLIENSDYLFSYIKDKAGQNLIRSANQNNIENLFQLLKYHSPDWDSYIAQVLSNFSTPEFDSRILSLLKSGSIEEKAYAARYFCLANNPEAIEALFEAALLNYEPLKINSAEALGKIKDLKSYQHFLDKLKSDDDWEKIEAAQFLSCYGNRESLLPILEAMNNSTMPEYIAGEAATLANLYEYFDDEKLSILSLEAIDNIISSLSEVWPLSAVLDFRIYDCTEKLIQLAKQSNNNISGKYALLLLKLRSRINLFMNNSEYTFDEEKTVLGELEEIYHLLSSEDITFWDNQVNSLNNELKEADVNRKISAINLIGDLEIKESASYLIGLISNESECETVICNTILALEKLGKLSEIKGQDTLISKIKDSNLNAIIQNTLSITK